MNFRTAQNDRIDELLNKHLVWACDYILENLGKENIEAIILIGSLSIGEATAFINKENQPRILSDFDIIIMANEKCPTDIRRKNNEINLALNKLKSQELLSPIDTIIMTKHDVIQWLETPTIVTLKVKGTARLIWGQSDILANMRPTDPKEVGDKEIFKLFCNRISEQIFYLVRYKEQRESVDSLIYHTAKAAVDSIVCACLSVGKYETLMPDRLALFEKICSEYNLDLNILDWANFWTRYKLNPDYDSLQKRFNDSDIDELPILAWNEAATFLIRLFSFVLSQRLKINIVMNSCFHKNDNYNCCTLESAIQRLTKSLGFYKLPIPSLKLLLKQPRTFFNELQRKIKYRHSNLFIRELKRKGIPEIKGYKIRKLCQLGSPQSLTYGAAALLLNAKSRQDIKPKMLLDKLSDILPLDKQYNTYNLDALWFDLAKDIADLWNKLVMDGRR